MTTAFLLVMTVAHFFSLSALCIYGLHRLWLLFLWYRYRKAGLRASVPTEFLSDGEMPRVTVQLPIYNEKFVARRLIDATAGLVWPREKLEIQILDDSNDETMRIIDERVRYWRNKGIDVSVFRRRQRTGYKAGALQYGLRHSSGEYIAIFDADFVPPAEFLQRTIPYFREPRIGMVQTRWDFLNSDQSWLTRVQAILLGAHFDIEHWVRFRGGTFFNFNGTAGVWRKRAIVTSGGWQSDTVTEDLDLSYRAQLAGWKFIYLDNVSVPSELPATLSAFRCQQQRWAKGSLQTARKILPRIVKADVQQKVRAEAFFHLLSNLGWLFGAIVVLTLFPVMLVRTHIGPYHMLRIDLPLFVGSSFSILFFFMCYVRRCSKRVPLSQIALIPILSIAIAPSIALSVIHGLTSGGGVFERTPKWGSDKRVIPFISDGYLKRNTRWVILDAILFAYALVPLYWAFTRSTWCAMPLLIMIVAGFMTALIREVSENRKHSRSKRHGTTEKCQN